MTHGEEPGPETHKDSAVLTYLEGLLMHPVVAGPGAAASRRSEAAHSNQEQAEKVGGSFQLPSHGPTAPKAGTNGPTHGASQHLKKARLLRSEAWNNQGNQRIGTPPAEMNGQVRGLQNGSLEGSPQGGESTLLASLLQSFSSRLQSVALSQNTVKPPSECSSPSKAPSVDKSVDREPLPVYGTASSRLKGLMRKSKLQNHSNTPYSRRGQNQDRTPESPRSAHSATPPAPSASESVSCAERLKAVANMVKIRSSPAPSPKPSVACSQLALLLSSEAHLQQYSREHALKAQLSGRSASERLAAMANQQLGPEKRPASVGVPHPVATDALASLTTQNGLNNPTTITATLPQATLSSPRSPPLPQSRNQNSPPTPPHMANHIHAQPLKEKRGFDTRPTRPPQTCSSLLLLLLNNHNQKQLTKNGHLEDNCGNLPQSGPSSVASDSECSTQEKSLTKDSSDVDSSYSCCSPIDLSMRNRAQDTRPNTTTPSFSPSSYSSPNLSSTTVYTTSAAGVQSPHATVPHTGIPLSPAFTGPSSVTTAMSAASLDKLTESFLKKWKPEPSASKGSNLNELEMNPDLKSHSKVTLMQLLLERRNNDMMNKHTDKKDFTLDLNASSESHGQAKGLVPWEEPRMKSPIDGSGASAQSLYTQSRDAGGALSPYPYSSPHIQSSPLDLCKSKAFPAEKATEPAFSASKLLQNLAQCGIASPSPPIPSTKGLNQETENNRPLALLERLNAPINRTTSTPLSEGPSGSGTPFSRKEVYPPSPQIENLLERRTVLQLLLGTGSTSSPGSRKERKSDEGRRSVEVAGGCYERNEKSLSASNCDSSNGPALDVKPKTELMDEVSPTPVIADDLGNRKRPNSIGKNSPRSDAQPDIKTEPRPAEVIAKYGLLSQLLKQQTATYYTSAALQVESLPRRVKEEQKEFPSPSPKKRRLCSDWTESIAKSGVALESGDPNIFSPPAGQEELDQQRCLKEEETLSRSSPSKAIGRESRGFNVLKQLLLSDNCLKEMSQTPHGASSPSPQQANGKANGSIYGQPAHNHSFLHLPGWHPPAPINSGLTSNLRPLPTPPTSDSPIRSPWVHHPAPWPVTQKRDPPTLVKQEPESPARWSGQENEEEDGCDSNPDSPRLSRSNPILYYMLQKGSIQLRKEIKEQKEGTHSAVRVKEEPISDMHAYEQNLSSTPQSPSHNDKHSRENQGLSQSSE
ncbi:nuclear receptor-interacting protein 1 [Synchiropus splendidus]|uniref:nuclear receptor-interacting protein 1 n=1 Tax=Synchiropus splendidus TaxID=270530 RepID=UPI00237EA590|nr:nuclear receptor-interacting protein 1 [Synchiropus splendidus]XP_053704110.1 nuclear receptor-interacting protein 1 [Synchiropus splendidus]XP_053704111.1 nuclear receptor-interacting protein 1 [Synchiropus splendidus]